MTRKGTSSGSVTSERGCEYWQQGVALRLINTLLRIQNTGFLINLLTCPHGILEPAAIASSTRVPIVGCGAAAFSADQRASLGTQKMLAARYSSGTSPKAKTTGESPPESSACAAR